MVRNHEPHLALNGGSDGLRATREVISGAMQSLSSKGWLMLEHHHDQSDHVLELMRQAGLKQLEFANDFNGNKRFAIGMHP